MLLHHVEQLAQRSSDALKSFILNAMPLIVQRRLLRNEQDSTYIAAHGAAWNLSHICERAASRTSSQSRLHG